VSSGPLVSRRSSHRRGFDPIMQRCQIGVVVRPTHAVNADAGAWRRSARGRQPPTAMHPLAHTARHYAWLIESSWYDFFYTFPVYFFSSVRLFRL
jgi:hypothetical protein